MHSEPEETFSRDLPEFPSVDEFPSMEHGLFHFPLGASAPADSAVGEHPESDLQSPASLLIQHLASPLHFVNTHFNGHGRLATAGQAAAAAGSGKGEGDGNDDGGEVTPEAPRPSRSLEALSEEIVSTAISTVVQNTLSALLRTTEAMEAPCMEEFMPTETPPCPMETTLEGPASTDTAAIATTSAASALPHAARLGAVDDEDVTGEASTEELPDVTLVPAEEEDFELLDQSELEMVDEGLGLGLDGQGVEPTVSTTPDTPASDDQHSHTS